MPGSFGDGDRGTDIAHFGMIGQRLCDPAMRFDTLDRRELVVHGLAKQRVPEAVLPTVVGRYQDPGLDGLPKTADQLGAGGIGDGGQQDRVDLAAHHGGLLDEEEAHVVQLIQSGIQDFAQRWR